MRIGDRVILKDTIIAPITRHGAASDPLGVIDVRLCRVKVSIAQRKSLDASMGLTYTRKP
jgi:hypothetical protein